jgi:uncharacterized membrane protein
MVIWCIFWGAMLGWFWPGSGDSGLVAGAFFGLLAGVSLRWVVRAEVEAGLKKFGELARTTAASRASAASRAESAVQSPRTLSPERDSDAAALFDEAPTPAPSRPAMAVQTTPGVSFTLPSFEATVPGGIAPVSATTASSARATPTQRPRVNAGRPAADGPNMADLAFSAIKNWFLGGNTIVRVGLVILFIGLSFLARYAAVAGFFPVELRLAAIGVAAIALLGVGFSRREAKPGFALALQGAGVAVLYLTVFAAFRLYGLVPAFAAFALMIVVCALSCALALLQDSRSLAVAAFAGGFAVPLLLSTGQGSHVALFSYYAMLNLAILFIALKRSWRILNVVGFIATFGVATVWGVLKYTPALYASSQPFLIGFILIYLFAAVAYARSTPTQLGNAVDTMLVFGTPLAGFGLQAGLVRNIELGMAFSALAFAALYLVTALVLVRRALINYRLLIECLIAVGVGFATLAVPLALDAQWTSAVWALEGLGAFWVGMRQARWMARAFGLLLQVVAAAAFLDGISAGQLLPIALANPVFIGAMLIALPAVVLSWWLRQPLPHSESGWARAYAGVEKQLAKPAYLYAFCVWCLAWMLEINRTVPAGESLLSPAPVFSERVSGLLMMLTLVVSGALSMLLGLRKRWRVATWPSRVSVVVMAFFFAVQVAGDYRVLRTPAWMVWVAVLALHYWMLRQNDRLALQAATAGGAVPAAILQPRFGYLHAASAWLVTLLLADCLWSGITQAELWQTSWAGVVLLVSAIAVLMLLVTWAGRANQQAGLAAFAWPLNPHAPAYYWLGALPLVALVFGGSLLASVVSSGRTAPLPYIPLLNPTDLTLAMALFGLVFWRRVVMSAAPQPAGSNWVVGRHALIALALLAFVIVNTVWLRVAHHFFSVAWNAEVLFASFVVQTGYAILWTLLALTIMVMAHRRVERPLWLAGAGLLGLVVVKLLLIDLSNAGGAERIIGFIVVGALMLVVGYFAPLPPKAADRPPAALPEKAFA